jgi:5-formyltetrahydrofolate cyclo-ligase
MPSGEIQTDEIVRHALSNGKEVFVPYLYKNEEASSAGPKRLMDMVRLNDIKDYEGLERDSWGIPTLTEQGVEGRQWILEDGNGGKSSRNRGLDLLLMPGVAFEKDNWRQGKIRRLGHGKGFYDYFLHRYRSLIESHHHTLSDTHLALYGLALKEQFLQGGGSEVPVGPLDSLLDGLIVGDGQTIR